MKMTGSGKPFWITWEHQRRSVELANALGIELWIPSSPYSEYYRAYKYLIFGLKTTVELFRRRPIIIFAQNPSIILVAILCAWKPLFRYKLIVDRHSNFKFSDKKDLEWKIFHFLSRYTIKNADLTIVTNDHLCEYIAHCEGRGFVLQDKVPEMDLAQRIELSPKVNVVVVSSFAKDEPLDEVVNAAKLIDNSNFYITGNCNKMNLQEKTNIPPNVIFTNYLPDHIYQSVLYSADIVLVLTNQEYTLTCGAYEAVALGKPMVLSDSLTIRNYFRKGAVYCKTDSQSIAKAIIKCQADIENLEKDVIEFKEELIQEWTSKFNKLKTTIYAGN